MTVSGHVYMDADLICEGCNTIVRPVKTSVSAELTCPCCEKDLSDEVAHFNERYGWDDV